jgi:peroxiredoxin
MRIALISCASILFFASSASAQNDTARSTEADAVAAIEKLMAKTRQGRDKPTESDLKARREAGSEMARLGERFLKDHPKSEKAEHVHGLINMGLLEASVAGDSAAAEALQKRAANLHDSTVPEQMKLHAFAVNHIAQWAIKNAKTSVDQGSPETQRVFRDALFAAADVLPDKDSIFQMLLLQAKSDRQLSSDEKRALAKQVAEHTHASPSIKAEAERILSGAKAYAVGKPLELNFTAVDGREIDLKDFSGKVVLIDFWATWCGPCIGQVPELKKVYETYHSKGFEILGISLDDKKDALLAFTKKHEMPWPQFFDGKHWNNEISFRFGINSIPATWLIDKKGVLRYTDVRFQLGSAVQKLLDE